MKILNMSLATWMVPGGKGIASSVLAFKCCLIVILIWNQ